MGNALSLTGSPAPITGLQILRTQSSLASDIQAWLSTLIGEGVAFFDFDLSGAGDGHSFVATAVIGSGTSRTGARVVSASDELSLQAARDAVLAELTLLNAYFYVAEAGTNDGSRWMCAILYTEQD